MDARAWRLAGGAGTALLVLVALVAWRADSLAGGWLLALRLAGLLAVVGLSAAVVLGALAALRPPAAPQVVVRVTATGSPRTTALPGRRALVPLTAVLLLAVLSAVPVLVVLVLATGPRQGSSDEIDDDAAGATTSPSGPTTSPSGPTTTPSTGTPTTASPTPDASTGPSAAPSTSPDPDPTASGTPGGAAVPATSPSQLPSGAGAPAGCEQVVVAGDSLWSLAARQLGPGAADADVDARWRAVYARNADAVGPDPDLVHPGLVLRTCA